MSRSSIAALAVGGLVVASLTFALADRATDATGLTYTRVTQGLDVPEFEGGDTELELGDVNGDGRVDLVSVGDHGNPLINTDQEGVLVWLGDGAGSFAHVHFGDLGYGGVALGDVDLDGHMDVAYGIHHDYASVDLGDQKLEVARGDGTGAAWIAWDDGLATEGQSWGMFATDLGDVDGDGDLDVGSTGFGSSDGFHVYLNDLDGTWRRSFGFLGGNSDHVFAFGDVDGDGGLDVATAKAEGTVWLGDGEGFFTRADDGLPAKSGLWLHEGVSLGDIDGDGRDDLAFCDEADDPRTFLSRGDPLVWQETQTIAPTEGTCSFTALADMDGDGLVDLVTFGPALVRVYAGDGAGTAWTEIGSIALPISPGSPKAFRVGGDLDRNGRPDVALLANERISWFTDRNQLFVYREDSIATAYDVRAIEPRAGRTLHAGALTFVDWITEVPTGEHGTVDVEWSPAGPAGPWRTIATGAPDNGRLQWRVPPEAAEAAHVRYTVTGPSGTASVVGPAFTIARKPDPVVVTFRSRDAIAVEDALGRPRLNVYRGDWDAFLAGAGYTQAPGSNAVAGRFCDLETATLDDPFTPAPGTLAFYLATGYRLQEDGQQPGVAVPMAEGTLGQASDAETRGAEERCPPTG